MASAAVTAITKWRYSFFLFDTGRIEIPRRSSPLLYQAVLFLSVGSTGDIGS
jgi:hypothetical protein